MRSESCLEQHLRRSRAAGQSPQTISVRRYVLARCDRDLAYGLLGADADEIADWLSNPRWSRKTKSVYYSHLKTFFRWAEEAGLVEDNPIEELIRPRTVRALPRPAATEALQDILARAANPYRRHVLLAAYGALRCIEISRLRREDITERRMEVLGKGDKPAFVPTHPLIWQEVRDLPRGLVCPAPRGIRDSPQRWISHATARYLRKELDHDLTMHQFRHWCGTETLKACKNLRTVQELLRHESPQSTAVYTLVTDEERRAAITALPTFGDDTPAAS